MQARWHPYPPLAPAPRAPRSTEALVAEWRLGLQVARLVARAPGLARSPRGAGAPVVLIPGWQTPEASMAPLGAYLRWLGHDARGWGLGVNEGAVREARDALVPRLQAAAEASGTRPALVGWSLGGVIAREVARERPDMVAQVITYGSPVVGGPTYTIGARAYGEATCRALAAEAEALDRTKPIEVPLTIVFSRADRVVAWPACIDRTSRRARHVEVASTHVGMGVDPDVWEVVAQQLVCAR